MTVMPQLDVHGSKHVFCRVWVAGEERDGGPCGGGGVLGSVCVYVCMVVCEVCVCGKGGGGGSSWSRGGWGVG
jgi:hypothetical protein